MPPRPPSVQSDGIMHSSMNQSAMGQDRGECTDSHTDGGGRGAGGHDLTLGCDVGKVQLPGECLRVCERESVCDLPYPGRYFVAEVCSY